ncbi:excalibur calcium-binding domain-containing protein [Hasllibacter sp. MH4015]|uniref:excalibur calcium-binding domain-containing protein n=1 Tax=Hasllibacter sp. MH4015 TaxID=2854029 RepID=UPI001CD69B3C|nr:excalibur calcium-binding domain-containing protein [Hasllibacter sp. MH4015]
MKRMVLGAGTIMTIALAPSFAPLPSVITPAQAQACHPSYAGVCISPSGGDVDCAGGNGNGPRYVQGPVRVVGPDEYRLDRDGDGVACERR